MCVKNEGKEGVEKEKEKKNKWRENDGGDGVEFRENRDDFGETIKATKNYGSDVSGDRGGNMLS